MIVHESFHNEDGIKFRCESYFKFVILRYYIVVHNVFSLSP